MLAKILHAPNTILGDDRNDILNCFEQNQGRLGRLHQSQVKAYEEAATKSIKEWALSFPLQPMEETDTKLSFVDRCVAAVENEKSSGSTPLPNWKLESAKATAIAEIRKRATETYEKYHPVEDNAVEPGSKDDGAGTAEDGGDEEGAETEDGEMTADDLSDQDGEVEKTGKPSTAKTNTNTKRNPKQFGNKNAVARKKGTTAKGLRSVRGGRGGNRRGGRGGGNRK